jgi:hypothetical protein
MPNFRPIPNANLVNFSAFLVVDLMIPGRQVWNSHLLEDLFDASTV